MREGISERPGARLGRKRLEFRAYPNCLKTNVVDQSFFSAKYLCFQFVEGAKYRAVATMNTMPTNVPRITSNWEPYLYRKGNSSSWQTTRPMMATMVTTSIQMITHQRDSAVFERPWLPTLPVLFLNGFGTCLIRVGQTIAPRSRAVEDPF